MLLRYPDSPRPGVLAALLLVLALVTASCRDAASPLGKVDDAVLAPTSWEEHYADDEFGAFAEGRVITVESYLRGDGDVPIAGARVELWAITPDALRFDRKVGEVITADDGRFLVGPAPRKGWAVRIFKDGLAPAIAGHRCGVKGSFEVPEDGPLRVAMRPGRPVTVRLVDESGRPVAGESVQASTIAYLDDAVTAADGTFTVLAPAEIVHFTANHQGLGPGAFQYEVPATGPIPAVTWKRSGNTVRGVVLDGPEGNPVADALVVLALRPYVHTRSGPDGRFEIEAGPADFVAAIAAGGGFRSFRKPPAGELELRLAPARTVTGTVVDADGRPVAGARIMAVGPRIPDGLDRVLGPVSGADGRFECSWIPAARRAGDPGFVVVAVRRGMGVGLPVRLESGDAEAEVTLSLSGSTRVRGTLHAADGTTPQHATADVRFKVPGLGDDEQRALGLVTSQRARPDPDGQYVFDDVPLGVGAEIGCDIRGWRSVVQVDDAASTEGDRVMPFAAPPGRPISGVVATGAGTPLPSGGTLSVVPLGTAQFEIEREVKFGPDGAFEFPDLPEGRYQLVARVSGFEQGGAVASAGDTGVRVIVERRAPVRVTCVFPEGTPADALPDELSIVVSSGETQAPARATAETEWVGITDALWPGRYAVRVRGGSWRGYVDQVQLIDGTTAECEVRVVRTLSRRVRVVDAAGEPVSGVQFFWRPVGESEGRPQFGITDGNGRMEMSGFLPGTWIVRATPHDRAPLETRFEIEGPDEEEHVLRMPACGTLSVSLGSADAPFAGAIVNLREPGGDPVVAWTDKVDNLASRFRVGDDGRLVITGVRAGPLEIAVTHASLDEPIVGQVDIVAGEETQFHRP